MRFQHRRREWEEEEEEEGARALPSISEGMQKKEALNQAKGKKEEEEEDYSAHEFPLYKWRKKGLVRLLGGFRERKGLIPSFAIPADTFPPLKRAGI